RRSGRPPGRRLLSGPHLPLLGLNGACTVPWPASCDRKQHRRLGTRSCGASRLARQVFPVASPTRAATLSYWPTGHVRASIRLIVRSPRSTAVFTGPPILIALSNWVIGISGD